MTIPLRPASAALPGWRREPYRLLFPLGIALAWAGVVHWLLLATGVIPEYRSIFHAFAQIEGFMTCFAVGFLFTLIPRRTATAPPAAWQMAVAMTAPVAITVCAWFELWAISQIPWLLLLIVLIQFAVSRFRAPGALLSVSIGFALRAAVALGVLLASAEIWRLPTVPGSPSTSCFRTAALPRPWNAGPGRSRCSESSSSLRCCCARWSTWTRRTSTDGSGSPPPPFSPPRWCGRAFSSRRSADQRRDQLARSCSA